MTSSLALFQLVMSFRRDSACSSTQVYWASLSEADEGPLGVGIAVVGCFGCEREDEARLSIAGYGNCSNLETGKQGSRTLIVTIYDS